MKLSPVEKYKAMNCISPKIFYFISIVSIFIVSLHDINYTPDLCIAACRFQNFEHEINQTNNTIDMKIVQSLYKKFLALRTRIEKVP